MKKANRKSPEYANFETALKKVLSVPKSAVMAEVERLHKPRKATKPNPDDLAVSTDGDEVRMTK